MSDTEEPTGGANSDWKRDPVWHYRNAVIAVIAIGVAFVAWFRPDFWQKPAKALTCDIIAVGPLVSVEDDVNHRVQVVFDHKVVPNVKFAVIEISNAGNVPIEESDFKRPLSMHFGVTGTSSVLTAQLLNTHPHNIGATYKVSGDAVTLNPILLNPGDSITLKVIYTGKGENMSLDYRVMGVSEVTGTDPERAEKASIRRFLIMAVAVAFVSLMIGMALGGASSRFMLRKMGTDPAFMRRVLAITGYAAEILTDEEIESLQQRHRERLRNRTQGKKRE